MSFLNLEEKKKTKQFLNNGYLILKVNELKSLRYITNCIEDSVKKELKKKKINLNEIHKEIDVEKLNEFRISIINNINKFKDLRYHYFNICRDILYTLVGNELMMQKNINLSIQLPNDSSSLLPVHSDVWSGDSPYEINMWLPLVNCYKTKSMYILKQRNFKNFEKKLKKLKNKNSSKIYNLIKNEIKWLKVDYGHFLIFNQVLPHGNIINIEKETRWSMNCRFKNIFSPYGDKKIGEFFLPITSRAMTEIGSNFRTPFE